MKLLPFLCRQHIDFMFKNHWRIQGKRRIEETVTPANLFSFGKEPKDAKSYVDQFKQIDNS